MEAKISRKAKCELLEAMRMRYRNATRQGKGKILDELQLDPKVRKLLLAMSDSTIWLWFLPICESPNRGQVRLLRLQTVQILQNSHSSVIGLLSRRVSALHLI